MSLTKYGSPRYCLTNYKVSFRRVVPTNYDPKGEIFLIASRFPTPPLACAFFIPRATVKDCCCSKGNVEDKILVPKPPKNCARCGHQVDGPYCQGCALLRKKFEEDLRTYFQDIQNTSESSDDSTNVVNAPREPFMCYEMVKSVNDILARGVEVVLANPCWNRPAFYDDDDDDDVDYTIAS
nr:hypothetical protein [Tanacetum cinerariifolium]